MARLVAWAFRLAVLAACFGGISGFLSIRSLAILVPILVIVGVSMLLETLSDTTIQGPLPSWRTREGATSAKVALSLVSFFGELAFITVVILSFLNRMFGEHGWAY